MSDFDRQIPFEGTANCRDFGGIETGLGKIMPGRLYRSERLSILTPADHKRLKALGVKTVIDMRSPVEIKGAPNDLPADLSINEINRPFLPQHTLAMIDAINRGAYDHKAAYEAMLHQYRALALEHTQDYRQIIQDLLAPTTGPALFHCTSGKDRTGLVAAIILLAVDTPREAVIEDYVLSSGRVEKVNNFDEGTDPTVVATVMDARAAYIQAALDAMASAHGSIADYLKDGVGIDKNAIEKLEKLLLAP